jgi:hypothetical protein
MKCMKLSLALAFAVVGATVTAAAPAAGTNPGALNGVYRIKWTEHELNAAGASKLYAHKNFGVITMTMQDGRFRSRELPGPDCAGTYAVSGHTISIKFTVYCHGLVTARWSLGNGQLRFRVARTTDPNDAVLFGRKPWRKIG